MLLMIIVQNLISLQVLNRLLSFLVLAEDEPFRLLFRSDPYEGALGLLFSESQIMMQGFSLSFIQQSC